MPALRGIRVDHLNRVRADVKRRRAEVELELVGSRGTLVGGREPVPEVDVLDEVVAGRSALDVKSLARAGRIDELQRHGEVAGLDRVGADHVGEVVVGELPRLDLRVLALAADPQADLRHVVRIGYRVVSAHMLQRPRVPEGRVFRHLLDAVAAVEQTNAEFHRFARHERRIRIRVDALSRFSVLVDLNRSDVACRLCRARKCTGKRSQHHREDAQRFLCLHIADSFH